MSLESRIEAGGRRVLRSPLWTAVAVTLFFVLPTVVIPGIPLWVSAVVALVIGPPTMVALYLIYGLYGRLFGSPEPDPEPVDPADEMTPVDRLKDRYANGEIDEETFERRLEQLMETDDLSRRLDRHEQSTDEIRVRNR